MLLHQLACSSCTAGGIRMNATVMQPSYRLEKSGVRAATGFADKDISLFRTSVSRWKREVIDKVQ